MARSGNPAATGPGPDVPEGVPAATDLPAARGSRFAAAHQRRAHLHRLHPSRLWRLVLGLALLLFGVVNVFIPGPGGSVLILSGLLVLAGESGRLARVLDAIEVRYGREVDWALRNKLAAIVISSAFAFVALSSLTVLYTQLR
jgi:hypothetical protein